MITAHSVHVVGRTITGAEQEKWLLDGFKNSTQRWDILGKQVQSHPRLVQQTRHTGRLGIPRPRSEA